MRAVTLCALATGAALVVPAAAAPRAAPALRVVDRTPVTVRLSGFVPRERVGVRLSARGRAWTRRAVAGEGGSLTVRFRVSLDRCDRYALRASGSAGGRARLLPTRPLPTCVSSS